MSIELDLKSTLSKKWIRELLTIEQRAELLCELTQCLQWDTYDIFDEERNYLGQNTKSAVEDLNKTDRLDMKIYHKNELDIVKMRFKDAPIGARFRLPNIDGIYIKINSYPKNSFGDNGLGLIVKWNGNIKGDQSHCCFVDESNGYNYNTEIELV